MRSLHQLIRRLAVRAAPLVLIAALALLVAGGWLYLHDRAELGAVKRLSDRRSALATTLQAVQQRIDEQETALSAEHPRLAQIDKIIADLQQLIGTWEWFTGDRMQLRTNRERLDKMQATRAETLVKLATQEEALRRTKWERDGHLIALRQAERELRVATTQQSAPDYALRRAWIHARSWIFSGIALYLLGAVLLPPAWTRWRERRSAAGR